MKRLLLVMLAFGTIAGYAQKVKLVQGKIDPLGAESSVIVQFTYNDMTIGGKGKTEAEYMSEKKADFNKKEAGRGDKWEKAWVSDRQERFEPSFVELFEKHSGMKIVQSDAKYTIIFHTTRTEPGFNVGVMRMPAYIDAEVFLVETGNESNVLAKITVTKAPGRDAMGFDFDTGYRIQEAYAKSGKEIGQFIVKNAKKK